jgi:hypothetical protein
MSSPDDRRKWVAVARVAISREFREQAYGVLLRAWRKGNQVAMKEKWLRLKHGSLVTREKEGSPCAATFHCHCCGF